MNITVSIFFFLALATFLTSCGQEKEDPAKIVVMLDLKGGQSTLGQEAVNGFLLAWQQALVEDSSRLYISLVDTQSDMEITKQAARDAAPHVSIGAGFTDNNSVIASGEFFKESEVPFLSIGATDPSLPEKFGGQIFLIPFGDNTQAAAAAEFASEKFGKNVAVLWDSTSEYTRNLPLYFKTRFRELEGKVAMDVSYPGGCDISDLGKEILQLKTPPDFIYLAGLPNCIGEVVSSLRSAGIQLPIIGGDGLDSPNLTNKGSIDHVWYTTHVWLESKKAKPFLKAYRDAYNTDPKDAFSALGYDTANLLFKVLKNADSTDPKAIYQTLENTSNFEGVTGHLSYSKKSHVPKKSVWIIEVNHGNKTLAEHFIPKNIPPPLSLSMQPETLYKIVSVENWQNSQGAKTLTLDSMDKAFIHLALDSQLDKIIEKFWGNASSFVILKLDPKKLKGELVLESNPGGNNRYYHLYSGSIPMDSIIESKIK